MTSDNNYHVLELVHLRGKGFNSSHAHQTRLFSKQHPFLIIEGNKKMLNESIRAQQAMFSPGITSMKKRPLTSA